MNLNTQKRLRDLFMALSLIIIFCIDFYLGILTYKMQTYDGIAVGLGFVELAALIVVLPLSLACMLLKPRLVHAIGLALLVTIFVGFLIFN